MEASFLTTIDLSCAGRFNFAAANLLWNHPRHLYLFVRHHTKEIWPVGLARPSLPHPTMSICSATRSRRRTMPSEPCVQHYRSSLRLPKREEARELLAPVYGWFTEGFDTRSERGEEAAR